MNTTDITFSDCDSQTDLYLKVLNVSSHVISDPYCGGGDGCGGCSNGVHESYTMQLSAGTYLIQVMAWNEGGDYQIDIDCAEPPERPGSNLFCNDSVTYRITSFRGSHLYVFTLMNTTDVTFSDCDSQTDIRLKVLNASSHVISDPYCDQGDGCGGCSKGDLEHVSYTMQLSAGTYQIQVMARDNLGDYQIDIDCADPLIPPGPNLFCNDSVTYRITSFRGSHLYVFTLMNTTDVTFSDCDSQIDLYLKVLNVSSHVISDPYCRGGNGCGRRRCSEQEQTESYTMPLSAGTYQIQVMARDNLGDYQVDIDCADPLIPPGPNLFCNDSVTYRISDFPRSHLYVFALMNTMDVTFSDCSSPTDIELRVLNASSHVISDPYCDQGDGCGGCSKGDLEHVSYTMQLSAGTYQIQVMARDNLGDYQ
eukprot:464112_1